MAKGFKKMIKAPEEPVVSVLAGEKDWENRPAELYATEKQMPQIREWQPGKTYQISVRMKTRTTKEGDEPWSAEFEVVKEDAKGEDEEDSDD